jgi:hypothetical protein
MLPQGIQNRGHRHHPWTPGAPARFIGANYI